MSARACVTRKTLPIRLRSLAAVHPIGRLLREAADGRFPPADGGWHRVSQWRPGLSAVLAFTGHAVFAVDDRVSDVTLTALGADGLGGATDPRLVTALAGPHGWIDSLDLVLIASGSAGRTQLVPRPDLSTHARARFASDVRDDVEVWAAAPGTGKDGAVVTLSRGMGGLPEISIELPAELQGRGVGRALIAEARRAVPLGTALVAAVAPGNAASVRAFLAAGFRPVGSVQLFRSGGQS
jgi:GNAT superfamily N-acetyltransferase